MVATQVDKFWKLLADSGLLTAARLADLQAEFGALRGVGNANVPVLAEWLVSQQAITRYHADVLLKGRPGPFVYGDFLVREIISSGRLAGTFRAVHRPTGYPVLLVFFGDSRPGDPVSWATTVACGMQSFPLDVPQLATCHEMVDMGVFRFAVLDDLPGRVLAEVLQDGRHLSIAHACGVVHDVAQALYKLHVFGQSHGDVRPENIMLPADGFGQLLHFPLSRSDYTAQPPLDAHAADYAAPELNPQQPVPTPAADIYALGCTLYQALSGSLPFAGPPADVAQKMARHASEPIVPLQRQGTVLEPINLVVSYMMAKDVQTRYADAKSVMAALAPFIDPARTQPGSAASEARKEYQAVAHRRRSTLAAAAAQVKAAAAAETAAAATPAPPPVPFTANVSEVISAEVGEAPVDQQFFGLASVNPVTGQSVSQRQQSPAIEQPWWHKRSTRNMLVVLVSVILVALVAMAAAMLLGPEATPEKAKVAQDDDQPAGEKPASATAPDKTKGAAIDGTARPRPSDRVVEEVIGDDGKTLWASPTKGEPPDLRYLPAGAQVVFMLRTADLFSDRSGKGLLVAMGPGGSWLGDWVKNKTTFELSEIERLDIALYAPLAGQMDYCLVVHPTGSLSRDGLLARWGNPVAERYEEGSYYRRGQRAFYVPQGRTNAFACGTVKQMHEVIDTLEEAAWLAAPLEKLRLRTVAQRHINILFLPEYLRSTRDALYPGRLSPLHEAVSWVLGPSEDVQAGLLSAHVGEQLFLELRLYCARHKKPQVMARQLHSRLGQAAGKMSAHLLSLPISPYSQPVLAGMPGMLHSLHQYTRHDRDQPKGQQAVLRCYLPAGAALHLAAAIDMVLLETAGTSGGGETKESKPKTVWNRLKKPTTLVFEKDNLINAMQLLSDDMGVPIEILGNDLQLEGITKNQSFGVDMRDQPAETILATIMLRANPTKVSDPADPALKLIYVVKEKHNGGQDVIWITTRAGAARRGDKVPPRFGTEAAK